MLFIRKIFSQEPEIIKLPATELWRVGPDNFLTVSSLDFSKSIKTVQKQIFTNTIY